MKTMAYDLLPATGNVYNVFFGINDISHWLHLFTSSLKNHFEYCMEFFTRRLYPT